MQTHRIAAALLVALVLVVSACGGSKHEAVDESTVPVKTTPTPLPPTHAPALRYTKRCLAAIGATPLVAVTAKRAPAVKKRAAAALAACNNSDQLEALVSKNRADPFVDSAYLGEVVAEAALGNYLKYVTGVAAGTKDPEHLLSLANDQMPAAKQRLNDALVSLPYPP